MTCNQLNGSCDRTQTSITDSSVSAEIPNSLVQLEQHLNLLRTVIDTTDDWIFVKDAEFRYVLVNQSFAAGLGQSPDSLLGKTDIDIGFSDVEIFGDEARGVRGFRVDDIEVLSGKSIHNPYDVVTVDDGTQLIFDTQKNPLKDVKGNVVGIVSMSKNVTDRYQAERQLAESRNLLQQVLDTFPAHVFWKDRNLAYLGCNQLFADAVGVMTPTDIIGKTDFDLTWRQTNAKHYSASDHRVIESNVPDLGIEEPQLQANGKQAWLETNRIPLRSETGEVVGLLGSFQDITERKQAEIELRTSQQRLNLIIQQTPLAVIEWDVDGRVQQWNPAAERTFGYNRAEALGQHMELIIPPAARSHVDQIVQALLAKTGGCRATNKNITRAGDEIVCEWYNTPLVDSANQVVGVASMAFDVTEQKQKEKRLKTQNRLGAFRADIDAALIRTTMLKETLQHCTDAMVEHLDAAFARVWTLDSARTTLELQASSGLYTHIDGAHGRVPVGKFKIGLIAEERSPHLTNDVLNDPRVGDKDWAQREGMVSFAGYPILLGEELLGVVAMFSRQSLSPETLKFLESAANELALGVKRHQTEAALIDSESSLRERTAELEQLMTDLQQTQLQVVQNEKMSALGNLVAGVAHEINNPVGFLKGNINPATEYVKDLFNLLDLYQAAMPDPNEEIEEEIEAIDLEFLREDLPKLLGSMNVGVDRIKNISTSLRTFSRADQDHKTTFNLHQGIDSTLLILKHRLKANDARPEIEITRQYGNIPAIECFAGQLNQVFMNLLANAIDALEEDNEGRSLADIKAAPNKIAVATQAIDDGQQVQVTIQDNGTGIPAEVRGRIFDHLFTTKAVGKGTGLGLAIAHQIVTENHAGAIQVESTPGDGTQFVLTLPVRASEPSASRRKNG
ncbi:MAG: PAS domain S-box protein [Cyanobacteria bacterium P01_D01_bin.14]